MNWPGVSTVMEAEILYSLPLLIMNVFLAYLIKCGECGLRI